jgi:hypothetical protein
MTSNIKDTINNIITIEFKLNCYFRDCGYDLRNKIFHKKVVDELKLIGYDSNVEVVSTSSTRLSGSAMNGQNDAQTINDQDYTFIGVSAGLLFVMLGYGIYRWRCVKGKHLKEEVVEVNKFVNSHPVALADATRTHSVNSISTVWTNIVSENENGHGEGFEDNVGTFYNEADQVLTPRGLGFNGNYGKEDDSHCMNISDEVQTMTIIFFTIVTIKT